MNGPPMHPSLPRIEFPKCFRMGLVGLALVASACASQPEFVHDSYDSESATKLFSEALNHLSINYIDPVDLREITVAGLNGFG